MARIAALTVAYWSSAEIPPFAASLHASAAEGGHQVDLYVIDNSADPDEIAALGAMPEIHRFIPSTENLGYGGGMNALVRSLDAEYDWYLVCNPDIRFRPSALGALVAAGDRHPEAAVFGPLIFGDNGQVYPSARAFPSIRTGVGHALFANAWPSNPWTARYHRGGATDLTIEKSVDWLSGACMMLRPEAFQSVDGFDEGFFMYFEDVDIAYRLARLGRQAIYVPDAVISHSGAHSTKNQAEYMRRVHHESARRYLDKKYTGWWLAPLRLALRIALWARREGLAALSRRKSGSDRTG